MSRITILAHRHGSLKSMNYFMGEIAAMWRGDGHIVTLQNGPADGVTGDILVQHVDMTVIPEDHLAYARRFPVAINARVTDVSKRRISRFLVRPGDDYRGPVIVKADRNHGGYPEAVLAAKGLMPANYARIWTDYKIYDTAERVPPAAWTDPDVVVERFLPERREGLYCLRIWMFLGDKETNSICYANEPLVKAANLVRRDPIDPPQIPEELRALRDELGFDYGKFDYAMVEGKPILYDANPTPTLGNFPRASMLPRIRLLADGLKTFL